MAAVSVVNSMLFWSYISISQSVELYEWIWEQVCKWESALVYLYRTFWLVMRFAIIHRFYYRALLILGVWDNKQQQ